MFLLISKPFFINVVYCTEPQSGIDLRASNTKCIPLPSWGGMLVHRGHLPSPCTGPAVPAPPVLPRLPCWLPGHRAPEQCAGSGLGPALSVCPWPQPPQHGHGPLGFWHWLAGSFLVGTPGRHRIYPVLLSLSAFLLARLLETSPSPPFCPCVLQRTIALPTVLHPSFFFEQHFGKERQ